MTYVQTKSYYTPSGHPQPLSRGQSNVVREEFLLIAGAFAKIAGDLSDAYAASEFGRIYQGSKTEDPTSRRDGTALRAGDLYFNIGQTQLRVFTGTAWVGLPTSMAGYVTMATLTAAIASATASASAAIDAAAAFERAARDAAIAAEANTRAAMDEALKRSVVTATDTTTFTPSVKDASGAAYGHVATGTYIVVGRLVSFQIQCSINSQASSISQKLVIDNLPFVGAPYIASYSIDGIFTGGWSAVGEYATFSIEPSQRRIVSSKTGSELFNYDGSGFRPGKITLSGHFIKE